MLNFGEYYSGNAYRQDVAVTGGANRADFIVRAIAVVEGPGGTPADPADGNGTFFGDANDTVVLVTQINIYDAAGVQLTPAQIAAAGILITPAAGGGGWQIAGLPDGFDFEITSNTAFQAVQIEAIAGTDTFKLGAITIGTTVAVGVNFDVPVTWTDSDGDLVGNDISVHLTAPLNTPRAPSR